MGIRETWQKLSKAMRIGVVLVMALVAVFMCYTETRKAGLHEDEAYTIVSSVSPVWEGIMATADENGTPAIKTREMYEEYAYFNILNPAMIYVNQASDVHPPLYYLVFHVLAMVFQRWTLQVAFLINLICFLMMMWMMVEILVLLGKEKAIIPCLIFLGFSVAGINMVTFQRMYTMVALFVMLTLYYNLKIWKDEFRLERGTMMGLGVSIVLGFLTQYFFVIYLVGVFGIMCVKMWQAKKLESLKKYILLHVGMGVLGVILYPASLVHIFASYRGVGALAASSMSLWERLGGFLDVIRVNIYVSFLVVLGILIVWWGMKKEKCAIMIILPAVVYVMVVMILAPYIEIRYLMPVLAVLMMGVILALGSVVDEKVLIGLTVVVVLGGVLAYRPTFLYEEYARPVAVAEENKDKVLVYVTDNNFTFIKNLREFLTYEKTAVVKEGYDEIRKLDGIEGEFVLRMDSWLDKGWIVDQFERLGYENKGEIEMGDYVGYVMKKV